MSEAAEKDDRTEEPTQRRLEEAIKRGDVAKSQEINTLFVLTGFTLALMVAASQVGHSLIFDLRGFLMNAHLVPADPAGLWAVGRHALWAWIVAAALPLTFIVVGGLVGGIKRLFGREALVQFIKGLLKIVIVGAVATAVLWNERDRMDALARMDVSALSPATLTLSLKLLGGVLAIYAFLAVGDAVYQRISWMQRQRMSKRELKEEFKEQEGSPEIKARLRQIRVARIKKRMMKAVPDATVVVTNPTHYAVALKYEKGMAAPICVAKGVDSLALRIRAVAAEHGVAVVENPPLARALHATVEIDAEIPVEHYKAVAEVVGYVLRLRRRAS
jgi:flagellar biosynthetic protein FlhB